MATLTERDYAKLAAAAARDLVDNQVPLNDSIEKLASSHDMNEEQLTRLCEASNNAAFNALFEAKGKTGSTDRIVEFDVAKPREILQRKLASVKQSMGKVAAVAESFDAIWESRPLSVAREDEQTKTAASEEPVVDPARAARERERDGRALYKAAEHLRHEKIAAAQKFDDITEKLYFHFRPVERMATFAEFEKDAMVIHGAGADAVLDHLRARLRLPEVTRDYAKIASRIVVSDETSEQVLFKQAVSAVREYARITRALDGLSA